MPLPYGASEVAVAALLGDATYFTATSAIVPATVPDALPAAAPAMPPATAPATAPAATAPATAPAVPPATAAHGGPPSLLPSASASTSRLAPFPPPGYRRQGCLLLKDPPETWTPAGYQALYRGDGGDGVHPEEVRRLAETNLDASKGRIMVTFPQSGITVESQIDPPAAAPAAELAAASPSSPKRSADGSAEDPPSPKRLKTNSPSPAGGDLDWADYGTTHPAVHAAIVEQTSSRLANRRHRSPDPDTWTDQGISSFCNEVLGELVSGALNSHELSKPHEAYLMTQIDMCRLKLVAPDSAGVL